LKILVCGEGPNDIGKYERPPEDGTLQRLLAQLVDKELTFERLRIAHLGGRRKHGGFAEKLKLALRELSHRECDALAYVVDGDRERDRDKRLREVRDKVSQGKLCAVGVAIRAIEAWLLADETAVNSAFGGQTPKTTKDPEEISDPKESLRQWLDAAGQSNYSLAYAELARHLRIEILEKRCPRGFGTFADEIRALPGAVGNSCHDKFE
jgi:uncharacterized protein DUF4276